MNQLKSGILLITILLVVTFLSAQSQTSKKSETVDTAKIAAESFNLINIPGPTFKSFQELVGSKEEAFVANEFKPAVENNSNGKEVVIEGVSYNGIRFSKETMNKVKMWFQTNYNAK